MTSVERKTPRTRIPSPSHRLLLRAGWPLKYSRRSESRSIYAPHDLRHTCLTNLAMAGVPINGIKEYAGHASIVETQKYLKFMPQSIDLAASVSTRLAALANVDNGSDNGKQKKGPGKARSASRAKTM